MPVERLYRKDMGRNFDNFIVKVEETDLWVGISKGFLNESLKEELKEYIIEERKILKEYIDSDSQFESSLIPYKAAQDSPKYIKQMSKLSFLANVGPMAGVAGAFSLLAGKYLKNKNIPEVIIENGGDIFIYGMENLTIGVYAGNSVFTNKISIETDLHKKEFGICSSSGSFGHSLSFGRADLVTVIAEDVILADLFATAICNKVKDKEDVEKIINELKNIKEISGAMIIMEDKLGIFGNLKIKVRN